MRARTRERWREKGKHVRRLNATEGLLFVVLWGGNEASEKGSRMRGGDKEEGESGNSALAEAKTSDRPARSACGPGPFLSNKQDCNPTNAAQEKASTVDVKQLWQEIKYCAIMRSTFHTWVTHRLQTLCST